ncbi:Gfo/Idh/MocA family protein (plasmid) [Halorientalis pallida]|uniref:Gfo/Idh/MocA family protein n=1 Tax=Halorientalis pallida TaxID=2479928 RepID=UPI003C705601
MRYGIVGTGYWGKNHVRVATELRDAGVVDEVVICDVDGQRAADLASTYDVAYTTRHDRLDADAASVATPSPTHEDIATDLLRSGTDLLVEKPLALSADAAWNIVETAREEGRSLGVGHIFRYHPGLGELKRLIDAGELGEIEYLHTARFSLRVPRDTAGVLYSLAVHDVDAYDYLLEERPSRVHCTMHSTHRDDIDETTTLTLDYGDRTGVIHSSWQIPVFGKRRDLAVVGTDGAAYLDYLADTEVEVYDASIVTDDSGDLRKRDEGKTVREAEDTEPLKREVREFVAAAKAGRDPPASGRVGARTVELLERAAAAAAAGRILDIRGRSRPAERANTD